MNTQTVETQATIHCNRCDKAFETPKPLTRDGFMGQKSARINEPCECPHCNQSDWHWVYASDVLPVEIKEVRNPDKRKKLELEWLKQN